MVVMKYSISFLLVVTGAVALALAFQPRKSQNFRLPDGTQCWIQLDKTSDTRGTVSIEIPKSSFRLTRSFDFKMAGRLHYSISVSPAEGIAIVKYGSKKLVVVIELTSRTVVVKESDNPELWFSGLNLMQESMLSDSQEHSAAEKSNGSGEIKRVRPL